MAETNSYIEYLPPVLWEGPQGDFLARFLRIFEKILTGIDDDAGIATRRDGEVRTYDPLQQTIARLHEVFNARRTPAEFLPYLASWLALAVDEAPTDLRSVADDILIEMTDAEVGDLLTLPGLPPEFADQVTELRRG